MSLVYERILAEDLDLGYGTRTVTNPAGGYMSGSQIGLHTFAPGIVAVLGTGTDGVDNTVSMQDAIDTAVATGAGTVYFPKGTWYTATGVTVPSNLVIKGAGGYNSTILKGASGQSILIFDTDTVSVEFVNIEGITFGGAGAYAIRANSLSYYLSTFQIRNCHFSAELAECVYGNLILCDIEYNDFGYYGTAGAAHRHIYSKGILTGLASNINRVTNNRFYHAVGDESIHFENGYMVYFKGNNIERNVATTSVNIKGMYGAIFRDNWFEQNDGAYQVVFSDDDGAINGNYITEFDGNWFDLSHVPGDATDNVAVINMTGATAWTDFINNSGVINNTQHISAYAAGSFDDTGLRTCFGWKIIAHDGGTALTAPVFTRSRGIITGTNIQTTDATLTNYVTGKFGVGQTSPVLKMEILAAHNDGLRLRNDSVASDPISAQLITDGADYGDLILYDATTATPVVKLDLHGSGIIYFGELSTDGTWKITVASNNLSMERRESGSYVAKGVIDSSGNLTLSGGTVIDDTASMYIGASDVDGSWRLVRSGDNLNIERRESGSWVAKGAFTQYNGLATSDTGL